jgi:hypothetical protein
MTTLWLAAGVVPDESAGRTLQKDYTGSGVQFPGPAGSDVGLLHCLGLRGETCLLVSCRRRAGLSLTGV